VDAQQIVARVNADHGTQFRLGQRYPTGQNQGAYALVDERGAAFVLKWNQRPSWLEAIERAGRITDRLRARNIPAPAYTLADTFDGILYWVQTALPGTPPAQITPAQLQQLFTYIDAQAGQAISDAQNWSGYVADVVFRGESGWRSSLLHYGPATRAVLERLTRLVESQQAATLRSNDIVHGDLVIENVLAAGDRVSGIVDWDAAGCGDRCLDLSKLLFCCYDQPALREPLAARIRMLSGPEALALLLVYNILAQLDWSIHHHSPAVVYQAVQQAHRILQDLEH
jgi:fructosamine-3-kinase